jgi:hypothetical protein
MNLHDRLDVRDCCKKKGAHSRTRAAVGQDNKKRIIVNLVDDEHTTVNVTTDTDAENKKANSANMEGKEVRKKKVES